MTFERRAEIFSKEVMTTSELAELHGITNNHASELLNQIKRTVGDRYNQKGKLFIGDYLKFYGIDEASRYVRQNFSLPEQKENS